MTFLLRLAAIESFNPRPRMGGDYPCDDDELGDGWFQSTPPYGGRLDCRGDMELIFSSFNPRPRMGGDAGSPSKRLSVMVSIHAPVWGATVRL